MMNRRSSAPRERRCMHWRDIGVDDEQETNEKTGKAVPEKTLFYIYSRMSDRCLFISGVQKLAEFFFSTVI